MMNSFVDVPVEDSHNFIIDIKAVKVTKAKTGLTTTILDFGWTILPFAEAVHYG